MVRTNSQQRLAPLAAVRAYLSVAVFVAAGFGGLWWYRLTAWLRGPSPDRATRSLQRWYRRAWPLLRLRVAVDGAVPAEPCVVVANHRSYLDVPVLAGVLGATFLSRADVADWPLVGPVARAIDAVFVDRDDPRGRMRAARTLLRRVRTASVVVFPEGTTTGERLPAPFEPGVFRLVHRVDVPVVPVTIRYSDRRVYWVEDLSLWQHLRARVYTGPPLRVAVHIGAPLRAADHADSEALAAAVYAAVCAPIERCGEVVGVAPTLVG